MKGTSYSLKKHSNIFKKFLKMLVCGGCFITHNITFQLLKLFRDFSCDVVFANFANRVFP